MPEPVLLLTGFGPFPGVSNNPTEQLASRLNGQTVSNFRVVGAGLTVCFQTIEEQIEDLLQRHQPEGFLLLGVAVGRQEIGLEGQAYNLREAGRPDAQGKTFSAPQAIHDQLPIDESLRTSLNREQLLSNLKAHDLPAETSEDPGRYLCNASFFHALHLGQRQTPPIPALFAHLPQLGNTFGKSRENTWTMEHLRSATTGLLEGIASQISRKAAKLGSSHEIAEA